MSHRLRTAVRFLRDTLRRPEPPGTRLRYRDLLFLARFARPVWKLGLLSLVLTILTTALSSLLPLSSKVLIDFIIMKEGFEKIESLLSRLGLEGAIPGVKHFLGSIDLVVLAILLIGVGIGTIGMAQRYLVLRFQQEVIFNLQTTLFDRLLRYPISFFRRREVGYLMSRVSDDIYVLQSLFSEQISHMVTNLFYLLFGVAIIFTLSVKLALLSVSILPFYVFINYYFGGRLRSVSHSEREGSAEVSRDLQEVFSGVETIKSYSTEEREVKKVSRGLRKVIDTRIKAMVLSLLSSYSVKGSQLVTTVLIMWFGAREILRGSVTIGDYVAFTSYVVFLSNSVNRLSMFHLIFQPVFASTERLMELFRVIPEDESGRRLRPDGVKGEIRFEGVTFSYEGGAPVLRDLSFTVHPGETVALVGPSGAGKTTLVNLVLGFYTPRRGAIYLDGRDLREIDPRWLREQTGVVSQDTFLFNDTVENNIRYGDPGATREEVVEAARKSRIHDEIAALPDGYDTLVGERGARLSAGQRQRISIARAFLKDPPILIFDEPTSALDEAAERAVKDSLKALFQRRTTFIISHRMSMTDLAQRIFLLEDGKIVEERRPPEG